MHNINDLRMSLNAVLTNMWNRIQGIFSGLDTRVTAQEQAGYITQETDPTVPSWAKQPTKPTYTATEVGAIPTTQKGAASGVAELDSGGKVPFEQLPYMVDTTANWTTKTDFSPPADMLIVYTDMSTVTVDGVTRPVAGFKVGDGNAYVVDLPFVTDALQIALDDHISDNVRHITANERAFWSAKLNADVNNETLILNRS